MFKMKIRHLCLILLTIFAIFANLVSWRAVALAFEDDSEELPTPISFINNKKVSKNTILIDSISFQLSKVNSTQTYYISEGYDDLIFSFKNVSAPIKFCLKTKNDGSHCAGFSGATNMIYINTELNSQYEFEWSLGFIDSDSFYVQTDLVDYSSGILEIYKILN